MAEQIVIIGWGGVGDAMMCTPVFRGLKESCPGREIIVYYAGAGQRDAFLHNPYIDSLRPLNAWKMWRYPFHWYAYLFNRKLMKATVLNFQHIPPSWCEQNAMDNAAGIFNLKLTRRKVELFFTDAEELAARAALVGLQNVVLLHVHSRTCANHNWRIENWCELVKQLPEYTFIQLGLETEPRVEGAWDWRGKTTMREALCLFKYASSFVGVEASLAHATNAFDTPGVVLFGDTSPAHWGHENNLNLFKGLPCSPCYDDLRRQPCPYGHECMETITVAEVKDALVRQMSLGRVPGSGLERAGEMQRPAKLERIDQGNFVQGLVRAQPLCPREQ